MYTLARAWLRYSRVLAYTIGRSLSGPGPREGSLALVISADRIFRITGVHHVFTLRPSVQDAVTTDQNWQAALTGDGHTTEEWCRNHRLL
jgi:hypothetical protein